MTPMSHPSMVSFMQNQQSCGSPNLLTHKVPRMPTMIDDAEADPMDVREFAGRPLHTVVDGEGLAGKMLKMFTDYEVAKAFAEALPKATTSSRAPLHFKEPQGKLTTTQLPLTAGIRPDGGYMELYEHIDFGGCRWRLLEYNSHVVGDYRSLLACGFWWWPGKSANNTISSFDARVSADLITFFDALDINFGSLANSLWIPGNSWVPNLVPWGWNDRITSHKLWYA